MLKRMASSVPESGGPFAACRVHTGISQNALPVNWCWSAMVSWVTCQVCNPKALATPAGRSGLFGGTIGEARDAEWLAPTQPSRIHVCWSCMIWMLAGWNEHQQRTLIAGQPVFVSRLGSRIFGLGDWSFQGKFGYVRQFGLCEVVPLIDDGGPNTVLGFRPVYKGQRLTTGSWEEFALFLDEVLAVLETLVGTCEQKKSSRVCD